MNDGYNLKKVTKSSTEFRKIITMPNLGDIIKTASHARLIPTLNASRKEQSIVSILLATLTVVPSLAKQLLGNCDARMGKTSTLDCYTEVEFSSKDGSRKDRPDGLLILRTGNNRWSALVEAKIDKFEIDREQIERYAEIARDHGIDAVITFSNQLAPLPTHTPYSEPKRFSRSVKFFHFSWFSIRTQALLILSRNELNNEQKFILEQMTQYFDHSGSGVRRFDQMNPEWRVLCQGVREDVLFKYSSDEIKHTVTSWFQEERDLCLMLSRLMDQPVDIHMLRKHQTDQGLRFKDIGKFLCEYRTLSCEFKVPNAVSRITTTINLERRTMDCSMSLDAPGHVKLAKAKINWLVRQLKSVESEDVIIRVYWGKGRRHTQDLISKIREDANCVMSEHSGALPSSFQVIMNRGLGQRFIGRKTFIEDLEKMVPEFYDQIGRVLRSWTPPPPSIEKHDPIAHEKITESDDNLVDEDTSKPVPNMDTNPT